MWKTMVRRFLIAIPQLFILSLVIFILANFMPGDALTGEIDPNVPPERLEELRILHGFYDPWYVKYGRWISNALRGNFGRSTAFQIPVTAVIGERIGNTFRLSLVTALLTYGIAIPLGIISGRYNGKAADKGIAFYTFFVFAMPPIVMYLIMLFVFGFRLRWFPIRGSVDVMIPPGTLQFYLSRLHHLVLPATSIALISTVNIIKYLRGEIINYKVSDFATTARSKGVPENVVFNKHILRNATLPMASGIGYTITGLLIGSLFAEMIFSYNGMGQLLPMSIGRRDFAVVNALVMFYAILTVLGGFLSDIAVTVVDPRIRIK